tara:strand:- start:43 stop:570 length:528 start_codon:yes stop_codon:yes gene_type:complete
MFAKYCALDHPYAFRLNPRLYDIIRENASFDTQGGSYRTDFDLHTRGLKEIDALLLWIKNIIPIVAHYYVSGGEDKVEDDSKLGFEMSGFHIASCWGIHYNKGQRVNYHNHFPYVLSFCYCVSAPQGSSPLVIEGEKIDVIPGRIVFFLGHQYHGTLPSKVDGRSMIVGNILYVP